MQRGSAILLLPPFRPQPAPWRDGIVIVVIRTPLTRIRGAPTSSIVVTSAATNRIASSCSVRMPRSIAISRVTSRRRPSAPQHAPRRSATAPRRRRRGRSSRCRCTWCSRRRGTTASSARRRVCGTTPEFCGVGSYSPAHDAQMRRTSRCATTPTIADATRNDSMPMSSSRYSADDGVDRVH